MAVTVGFEPTVGGYPTQLFESCTFGRSDTSPRISVRDARRRRQSAHTTLGRGGPRRASALADDLRQTRPTMSKQLARLESAGLIARTPDPADGRASIVTLTDAGTHVYTQLVEQGLRMIRAALHDWDAAERADFAAHTTRFVAAVESHSASAPSPDAPSE